MKQLITILVSMFALSVLAATPAVHAAETTSEQHEMKLAKKKDHSKDVVSKKPATKSQDTTKTKTTEK